MKIGTLHFLFLNWGLVHLVHPRAYQAHLGHCGQELLAHRGRAQKGQAHAHQSLLGHWGRAPLAHHGGDT